MTRRLPFNGYISFGQGGTTESRRLFAESLLRALEEGPPRAVRFPQEAAAYSRVIENIARDAEVSAWCAGSAARAEELCSGILAFIERVLGELARMEGPYEAEYALCREISALNRRDFMESWPEVEEYLGASYGESLNTEFISRKLLNNGRALSVKQFESVKKYLVSRLQYLLATKNLLWQRRVFEARGETFLEETRERIRTLNLAGRYIRPASDESGRLWNTAKGAWQKAGYDVLSEYSALAERDTGVKELARALGRTGSAGVTRRARRSYAESRPDTALEIDGIATGSALNMMLPSEAALLLEDDAESLFYMKWRRRELLVFNAEAERVRRNTGLSERGAGGPFVLCVDTSGSMRGGGEKMAKSFALALLREAFKTKRLCYLISFSTESAAIELTGLSDSLDALLDFLSMSFYGGSQIEAALEQALCKLDTDEYGAADVIVVSDFVLPSPSPSLTSRLLAAKAGGAAFHGIVTGRLSDNLVNQNLLSLFDTARAYDIF